MNRICHISIGLLMVFLTGCEILGSGNEMPSEVIVQVPEGFPPVPVPAFNPMWPAKIDLGERLFFDPILSGDSTVSCATCHDPDLAFSDGNPLSIGIDDRVGLRNAPSLINVAYQRLLFWDGGSFTLEAQVLAPLENEKEMHADLGEVLARLESHSEYPALFEAVFDEGPTVRTLTQAVAAYERTLVSAGSRYDRYLNGDTSALSDAERNGLTLFEGKAGCVACHEGYLLTNLAFENKGLSIAMADSGRARITGADTDFGKFKVPSLRNVGLTAPYMHDGRYESLLEVLDHYNRGGDDVQGVSQQIQPLGLDAEEIDAMLAFLHSLTDE